MMKDGEFPTPVSEQNLSQMFTSITYKVENAQLELKSDMMLNNVTARMNITLAIVDNGKLKLDPNYLTHSGWLARRVYDMMEEKYLQKVKS